jgi:hypothetical protein
MFGMDNKSVTGRGALGGAKVEILEGEHDTRSAVMFEFKSA